jgi:YD repeat-containing protein
MSPVVSFDYDSALAGDLLGPGWQFAGFYTIDRCPASAEPAGPANPPDRFCAEGQRLVAVQGTYGADGTRYRAENDDITLFVSHGRIGDGPAWFEMRTKKGLTLDLGNTPNSRRMGAGGAIAWRMTRLADAGGTYSAVTYETDSRDGYPRPTRIDYSANDKAGLKPYNAVLPFYEDAPAIRKGGRYPAGTKHLTRVQILAEGALVGEYRLAYLPDGHLRAITRCDGPGACLPPVSLSWREVGPARFGAPADKVVLLSTFSSGLGVTDRLGYVPAPPSVAGSAHPLFTDFAAYPDYVISSFDATDGSTAGQHKRWTFAGGRMDMTGQGFLGFAGATIAGPAQGEIQAITYSQDVLTVGTTLMSVTSYDGRMTSRVTNTLASRPTVGSARFTYVATQKTEGWDLDGTPVPTLTTSSEYDEYGDETRHVESYPDGWTKTTDEVFFTDPERWFVGRITAMITHTDDADSHALRKAGFAYDHDTGEITQEVIEPDLPAFRLQTDYGYSPFGERLSKTTSGVDIATRARTAEYDDKGRFRTAVTDALGRTDRWEHDPVSGQLVRHVAPDGSTEEWRRDGFGRIVRDADGDRTYDYCAGVADGTAWCPQAAAFAVTVWPQGRTEKARTVYYYDARSRLLEAVTVQPGHADAMTTQRYDEAGNLVERCDSAGGASATMACAHATFDALNRAISSVDAKGHSVAYTYHGQRTEVANTPGSTIVTERGGHGQIVETITDGVSTAYERDALGYPVKTVRSDGSIEVATYDKRGNLTERKTSEGTWRYKHDVLGETVSITDPKGLVTNLETSPTRVTTKSDDSNDAKF